MCVFEVACLECSSSSRDSLTLCSLYEAFALVASSAGDIGSFSSMKVLEGSCVSDGWAALEAGGALSGGGRSVTTYLSYSCDLESRATFRELS